MSGKEKRELLDEQRAAAHEINKHVSVTAGPGSGKTTVLVERYLHILRERKLSIDQIVAITFTNRAANEMRERLRRDLNDILDAASPVERSRWLNYKRTLDGAVITTIHGFCARLLREFPVEAGVDPQFLLLDEHRAAMLLESVVEEVLSEFINAEHVEISRLTLGVGRSKLAAALAQVYREVRGQGLSIEELALRTARSHASEEDLAGALSQLDRAMADFLAVPRTTPAARISHAQISAEWPNLRKLLGTIPSHEALADYCRGVESFRDLRPKGRALALAEHLKALDALVWAKFLLGSVPQICLDIFARGYALEMVNLLGRIDQRLNEEKQKLSALDFDDLEILTLAMLKRSEVLIRAADRYRFFLVDEFQDTNGLQRQLLERLALSGQRSAANLFIVGDRKQSIYGFRGADVDVFRAMTAELVAAGGEPKDLQVNFRSQPQLISFFNHLFPRIFQLSADVQQLEGVEELGYVAHEASEAKRESIGTSPLVELLVTTKATDEEDPRAEPDYRALDARQVARRILALKETTPSLKYSEIALLFRAMTKVQVYESTFRQANIPYQTVLGRGFYEREEITDLIQLLRFLDNKTDELALAAVLRSPLCGISDNALLALRCAPALEEVEGADPLRGFSVTRRLYGALRRHREIAFIADDEHELLDRAANLMSRLIARRHHYGIEDLLRFAVAESENSAVIAANFDGAQRLANVQRLFTLAARFEQSGTHLIRDFVRYVEEFEAVGSRESEGQIDEASNAVRLMTIHQAKGLEFPVVIIPELQRLSRTPSDHWVLLDRHHGLTLKVPDGRGKLVAGCTFSRFEKRAALREQFENMRLLYVAATRAKERLILSGASEDLAGLSGKNDSWLKWIWQSLQLEAETESRLISLADNTQLQLTLNLAEESVSANEEEPVCEEEQNHGGDSLAEMFPLLQPVKERECNVHRFSVTRLINYQRCPRQYYFDRVLELPSMDELAVWNNAEAPEPPANLTATLKGAVIHRFCERYTLDQSLEDCLRHSFDEVVRLRQAALADRLVEIDSDEAVRSLLPLARNYLSSDVFARVEAARKSADGNLGPPSGKSGLWSELSFRLRRPLGVLHGIIDKLLITHSNDGVLEIEIIDFKTNRIASPSATSCLGLQVCSKPDVLSNTPLPPKASPRPSPSQFAFDFESASAPTAIIEPIPSVDHALMRAARDYQLQMQAYALAVRELIPSLSSNRACVTLHFLEPNLEVHLAKELLEPAACARAIDEAMLQIVSSSEPKDFPVNTATHCRMCNFLSVCTAGREWLREN